MIQRSLVMVICSSALAAAACGGAEEITTNAVALNADPACGSSCPETCWVDIEEEGAGYRAYWFIFDADELNQTALENGEIALFVPGDDWTQEIAEDVPSTVPSRLDIDYFVPGTFDVYDTELEAKVFLSSPVNASMTCGVNVE